MTGISYKRAENISLILVVYTLTMILGLLITFQIPKFGLFYTVFAFTRMKLNLRGLSEDMRFSIKAGMWAIKLAPAIIWLIYM